MHKCKRCKKVNILDKYELCSACYNLTNNGDVWKNVLDDPMKQKDGE